MGRDLLDWNAEPVRWQIAHQFALWATCAAVRSQGQKKEKRFDAKQRDVNRYLSPVEFDIDTLFNKELGSIGSDEFNEWHVQQINRLKECHTNISVGWAAKMIAVYLKTTCYLSGFGRDGLDEVIHPPFDTKLRSVMREYVRMVCGEELYEEVKPYLDRHYADIDVKDYERIFDICKVLAKWRNCTPFEVEQLWTTE